MQKFEPIYIYTQALDNTSDDLMYQIIHKEKAVLTQITDLSRAQEIMSNMNAVVLDKNLKNYFTDIASNAIKRCIKDNKDCLIYSKNNQIVIKLKTNEKDNLGRHSFIQVLLNIPNISQINKAEYASYFYDGFMQFCKQAGKTPTNIELIETLPFIHLSKMDENEYISKPNKKMMYIVGICIAVLIILILKSCNT